MKLIYPATVEFYDDGIVILKKTCFLSKGDVIITLKTIVIRAFYMLSIVQKENKQVIRAAEFFGIHTENDYKG